MFIPESRVQNKPNFLPLIKSGWAVCNQYNGACTVIHTFYQNYTVNQKIKCSKIKNKTCSPNLVFINKKYANED